MPSAESAELTFESQSISAKFIDPAGQLVERPVEIRTNPITGRTCRIAFSRINEKEAATDSLPQSPPAANDTTQCPFCRTQVTSKTPRLHPDLASPERLSRGDSLLFPNLFPYGSYSAVSLFNDEHYVEIGTASVSSYADSFINSSRYLKKALHYDPYTWPSPRIICLRRAGLCFTPTCKSMLIGSRRITTAICSKGPMNFINKAVITCFSAILTMKKPKVPAISEERDHGSG